MGEKEVLVNLDELENSSLALNQQQEADYNGDFEDSQNVRLCKSHSCQNAETYLRTCWIYSLDQYQYC